MVPLGLDRLYHPESVSGVGVGERQLANVSSTEELGLWRSYHSLHFEVLLVKMAVSTTEHLHDLPLYVEPTMEVS